MAFLLLLPIFSLFSRFFFGQKDYLFFSHKVHKHTQTHESCMKESYRGFNKHGRWKCLLLALKFFFIVSSFYGFFRITTDMCDGNFLSLSVLEAFFPHRNEFLSLHLNPPLNPLKSLENYLEVKK